MTDNIIFLGYAMYCDNCGKEVRLACAKTEEQTKQEAAQKGWIDSKDKQYCSASCYREAVHGQCAHIYSRSEPTTCAKCGHKRQITAAGETA